MFSEHTNQIGTRKQLFAVSMMKINMLNLSDKKLVTLLLMQGEVLEGEHWGILSLSLLTFIMIFFASLSSKAINRFLFPLFECQLRRNNHAFQCSGSDTLS